MMKDKKNIPHWQIKFNEEMHRAEQARAKNNEGQARVCARRAAGMVVREYLIRQNMELDTPNAYDLLKKLAAMLDVSPTARLAAERLILKVDESFKLPAEVDLLAEARLLLTELLPE